MPAPLKSNLVGVVIPRASLPKAPSTPVAHRPTKRARANCTSGPVFAEVFARLLLFPAPDDGGEYAPSDGPSTDEDDQDEVEIISPPRTVKDRSIRVKTRVPASTSAAPAAARTASGSSSAPAAAKVKTEPPAFPKVATVPSGTSPAALLEAVTLDLGFEDQRDKRVSLSFELFVVSSYPLLFSSSSSRLLALVARSLVTVLAL